MSQLTHPNTVKVFMYGELEEGSLYIVMELLEGRNLNQAVRRDGPIPVARAIPILIQVVLRCTKPTRWASCTGT